MTKRQWAMVEKELGNVAICARSVVRAMPISIEIADLVGVGQLALIAAAQRYEPARGVAFGTYARYRVRGAMLDSVRRQKYKWELHDELAGDHDPDVAVDTRPLPDELAGAALMRRYLERALTGLAPEERYAILTSADGGTLEEIGAHYGRSISWASARLKRARDKMRRELAILGLGHRRWKTVTSIAHTRHDGHTK